ncbi:MAG: hypothetical protein N2Z22_01470 [Turneriella sp.]|nr:hypothetical protein [Turneriella sp.]
MGIKITQVAVAAILALALFHCGSAKVAEDPRDIVYPSSVEKADAQAAINDAQAAYDALGEDGSAETGKAKEFLDKAKEYQIEKEYEAAWAAAIKAKSYCELSALLRQTRAAGLK